MFLKIIIKMFKKHLAHQETNKLKATWMQQPSFMRDVLSYVIVNLHHKGNPGFCNEIVM